MKVKEIKELLILQDLINNYETNDVITLTKKARFSFARYLDKLISKAGELEKRELLRFADYLLNNKTYLDRLTATPKQRKRWEDLDIEEAKKNLEELVANTNRVKRGK